MTDRIQELLESNNRYQEEAREARREARDLRAAIASLARDVVYRSGVVDRVVHKDTGHVYHVLSRFVTDVTNGPGQGRNMVEYQDPRTGRRYMCEHKEFFFEFQFLGDEGVDDGA